MGVTGPNGLTGPTGGSPAGIGPTGPVAQLDAARIVSSTTQSIILNTPAQVVLGTVDFDANNNLTGTTNQLTIQTSGYYSLIGSVMFDYNPNGTRRVYFMINDVMKAIVSEPPTNDGGSLCGIQTTHFTYLAAGTVVELWADQNGTASLNISSLSGTSGYEAALCVSRIR
jgi:hypothetical protein